MGYYSPSEESEQVDEPKEPLDASELADSAEDGELDSASDTPESANAESTPNRIGWYLGWFVFSAVGLGILVAWDVIQASAKKSVDLIYNDDGGGTEGYDLYEKAEAAWARGHLYRGHRSSSQLFGDQSTSTACRHSHRGNL